MSTLFNIPELTKENDAEVYSSDFQTPPKVCAYMASLVPAGARTILEPTPGNGNLVAAVSSKYEVHAPVDFFMMEKRRFDCIIMNPPFSAKFTFLKNAPMDQDFDGMRMGYWFLTQCMELSDDIIALMPWFTLSDSDVRLRFLKEWGIISITSLPRKTFKYARIQTCIIQMKKGYKGPTEFKVYDLL